MRYRELEKTGLKVSEIGLGAECADKYRKTQIDIAMVNKLYDLAVML